VLCAMASSPTGTVDGGGARGRGHFAFVRLKRWTTVQATDQSAASGRFSTGGKLCPQQL
jgi:hypothetical protein